MKRYEVLQDFITDANVAYLRVSDEEIEITAMIDLPDGASDDYGYLAMKAAIIREWSASGRDAEQLVFPNGDGLNDDAHATVDVDIEISESMEALGV